MRASFCPRRAETGGRPARSRDMRTYRARCFLAIAIAPLVLFVAPRRSPADPHDKRVTRTDRWTFKQPPRALSVENVSGDVQVVAGTAFGAQAEVLAWAESVSAAEDLLKRTEIHF